MYKLNKNESGSNKIVVIISNWNQINCCTDEPNAPLALIDTIYATVLCL